MKSNMLSLALAALLLCCSSSDNAGQDPSSNQPIVFTQIDLAQPWQTASPASQNVDDLSDALSAAEAHPRMTSLVIVRNGKLVHESYFDGHSSSDLQDVRSVTKSVLSTLIGLAIENGFINSINDAIGNYMQDSGYDLDSTQESITFDELLTMSGGFEWDEWTTNIYNEWVTSPDPLQFLLDKPFANDPGETFTYNTAATYLLGVVLSEAANMSLSDFANTYLFSDMGIDQVSWEFFNNGSINSGSGIDLKPRDLAKFGQLYLQEGLSDNDQIVPANWISSTTQPQYTWRFNFGPLTDYTYGKLWWTRFATSSNDKAYLAWGFGGQFIYVVPDKNLVVVTTTNWINSSAAGGSQFLEQEALKVIIDEVLPQVN